MAPPSSTWLNRLLFLGSGTSGQVPAIHCLSEQPEITCAACRDAYQYGKQSKNRRGCCSVAVMGGGRRMTRRRATNGTATNGHQTSSSTAHGHQISPSSAHGQDDEEVYYEDEDMIIIDAGATFYGACVDYFRPNNIPRRIAGVLLTHGHADAVLGLDNLRAWTMGGVLQEQVDVYLTEETMKVVAGAFPYLIDMSKATGGGGVGALRWNIIDPTEPFTVQGSHSPISVTPLPVYHGFASRSGPPFDTLGFRIDSLSYVSDCHAIPTSTAKLMAGSECVVIDSLMPRRHPSHFSTSQAISLLLSLPQEPLAKSNGQNGGPSKHLALGVLTDITHRIEHHELQQELDAFVPALRSYAQGRELPSGSKQSRSRTGEGSGPRWWSEVWDEDKAERTGRIEMDQSINAAPIAEAVESSIHVPDIEVAWDGMVIHFDRRTS